jgi:DNA-binding MarR family transcriptional regulator
MNEDAVDRIVGQWHRELPDLELEAMAVFGRIHRVSRKIGAKNHATFAEFGIGRNEFDVLASLRRSGEPFTLSPKQIGATLMLSSGGLTGRLDKLESAGFIERLPDPSDRRGLKIRLTEAGRAAVEGAVRAELVTLEEALAVLDAKERKAFGELLRKLHGALEDQPFS